MPRPIWKGSLSFGLVMMPVTLSSAEASEKRLSFHMLDRRDHSRIKFQRVSEATGKEVSWKDTVKGYQLESGKYVELLPEDFKRAAPKASRTMEIVGFVRLDEVPPRYFERPFILEPQEGGEKGYALLLQALAETGLSGIARFVLHTREYLAALLPEGPLLTVCALRFADELRGIEEFEGASRAGATKVTKPEMQMAVTLVKSMAMKWDPTKFHDSYTSKLRDWIKQRVRSGVSAPPAPEDEPETGGPYSIMELLKRSVEGKKRGNPKPPEQRTEQRPHRRRAG